MFGWRDGRRQTYVAMFAFPVGLGHDLRSRYPSLTAPNSAERGLRQWLRLHVVASEMLAMPSRAVDSLWHEFILDTQSYRTFCHKAYGRMLEHTPERVMPASTALELNGPALARTFALACRDEGIRPDAAARLPLLFRVDEVLDLPDRQRWTLRCGHDVCGVAPARRCIEHELLPLLPKRSPHLIPFYAGERLPAPPKRTWTSRVRATVKGVAPGNDSGGWGEGGGPSHAHGEGGHGCGGGGHG